jgi:hypothetical protein
VAAGLGMVILCKINGNLPAYSSASTDDKSNLFGGHGGVVRALEVAFQIRDPTLTRKTTI